MARKNQDTKSSELEPSLAAEAQDPTPTGEDVIEQKLVQGFLWSSLPGVDERLEECLWNAGVTETTHLNTKPNEVIAALQAYYLVDLGRLREELKEYEQNEQH